MFNFLKPKKETPSISERYSNLRSIIIKLTPQSQEIRPSDELLNVWGILIETSSRFAKLTISVAALADAHTSIYASEGAAYIGINTFPEIAEVSNSMLITAEKLLPNTRPTTDFPIATYGSVHFFIFTYFGAVAEFVNEKELYKANHPFAPLHNAFREILHRNRILMQNHPDKMRSLSK